MLFETWKRSHHFKLVPRAIPGLITWWFPVEEEAGVFPITFRIIFLDRDSASENNKPRIWSIPGDLE